MHHRVDLLEVLRKTNRRLSPDDYLIENVNQILQQDYINEKKLNLVLEKGGDFRSATNKRMKPDRIFTKNAIREVAIRYQLRFLDSSLFKGDIPREALIELRKFSVESKNKTPICKILAPAKKFRLNDGDTDPMLFVELMDGRYYLIHKWGKDFSVTRKFASFPFSSFAAILATILILSFVSALLIPTSWVNTHPEASFWNSYRIALIPWTFLIFSAAGAFTWFVFNLNLSSDAWQSSDEKL